MLFIFNKPLTTIAIGKSVSSLHMDPTFILNNIKFLTSTTISKTVAFRISMKCTVLSDFSYINSFEILHGDIIMALKYTTYCKLVQ